LGYSSLTQSSAVRATAGELGKVLPGLCAILGAITRCSTREAATIAPNIIRNDPQFIYYPLYVAFNFGAIQLARRTPAITTTRRMIEAVIPFVSAFSTFPPFFKY